jgi:hypothetical protein
LLQLAPTVNVDAAILRPMSRRGLPGLGALLLLLAACADEEARSPVSAGTAGTAGTTGNAGSAGGAGAAGTAGASGGAGHPGTIVQSGDLSVTFDVEHGTFDVARGGRTVIRRATADALLSGEPSVSIRMDGDCSRSVNADGDVLCNGGAVDLRLSVRVAPGGTHLTAELSASNAGEAPVNVLRLTPVLVEAEHGGALSLGKEPARHRILENGRYVVFDQTAQLVAGDIAPFPPGKALGLPLRGSSISNFSQVVTDLDGGGSLVAGYLTVERSIPTLGIGFDADIASTASDGRQPFTTFASESVMIFRGKTLSPGQSVASELLYLDPLPADPLEGLERYADTLAAHQGVVAWPKREGRHVPNGWNSWSGGSTTGGHGQDIDAALIASSVDVMKTELLPFGDLEFQVDDGWQKETGDWEFRPDRFPQGGAALAQSIAAAGLVPGLWYAPFTVKPDSALAALHPEWLQASEDGIVGSIGPKNETLDLSNPAVLDHLRAVATDLRSQGWKWIKADFAYWDLLGKPGFDPSLTNMEAFRKGWRTIREALGPDVFLLGIGIVGANVGVVDGMRLTLDSGPRWEETSADDILSSPRAMKGTVRTGSRRWFYQNRAFVVHDDSLYFRSDPDPEFPSVSLEEARTFATWVALEGGSIEIGDRLVEMSEHPEWIDTVRRLVPAWPEASRPLDVMVRDYPEEFRRHIEAPAGSWDTVGLFNWGKNRDLSTNPPTLLPEAPRTHHVACDGVCLAYELWSGEFLGEHEGGLDVTVDPRRVKVIALRQRTDVPQLLGSNRHVTLGAVELGPLTWDDTTRTLSGTILAAAGTSKVPFQHELAFHIPASFGEGTVQLGGASTLSSMQSDRVLRARFTFDAAVAGTMQAFSVRF